MVILLGRSPGGMTHGPAGAGGVVGVGVGVVDELVDDASQGAALMPLSVAARSKRVERIEGNILIEALVTRKFKLR